MGDLESIVVHMHSSGCLQVDRLMTTVEDLSLVQDQASMVMNGHFLRRTLREGIEHPINS